MRGIFVEKFILFYRLFFISGAVVALALATSVRPHSSSVNSPLSIGYFAADFAPQTANSTPDDTASSIADINVPVAGESDNSATASTESIPENTPETAPAAPETAYIAPTTTYRQTTATSAKSASSAPKTSQKASSATKEDTFDYDQITLTDDNGEYIDDNFPLDIPAQTVYNEPTFPGSSMVEQEAVNFEVAGSSPAPGATE